MSTMRSGNFPESLKPGLRKAYFSSIKEMPKQFRQWANVLQGENPGGEAGKSYFEDLRIASIGSMAIKGEGDPIEFDHFIEDELVRYTPATSALGLRITMEAKQDGKYGIFEKMAPELGYIAVQRMEYLAHRILNEGTSTTGGNGFTAAGFNSEALFSTSHSLVRGGTQANRLTTDVDLSVTGVELASDLLRGTVDESGFPKPIMRGTLLYVPYQSRWVAREITQSELKPYTGNNEVNPLGGDFSFMESYWLTDSDSWFLMAPKAEHDLNVWIRMPPDLVFDEDWNTRDTVMTSVMRMAAGHGDYRGVVGSYGA